MHKFSQFNSTLTIERLALHYSVGDLSSIRGLFTPEGGNIGRTQLPILPPISESILQEGLETEGYIVELSSSLMVSSREFLKMLDLQLQLKKERKSPQQSDVMQNYATRRREYINRIGTRLVDVIRQERRLGLYNLFWLVLSKYLVSLFERVLEEKGGKQTQRRIEMLPTISQTLLEIIQQVKRYLYKEDDKDRRHYSKHIDNTISSHLGTAFNFEFSHSIINDQVHLVFPELSRNNLMQCAQAIFSDENEKYHITYDEFSELYSGIRNYMEKRLRANDSIFRETVATVLQVPVETVRAMPIDMLLFQPAIISLFAEDIRQQPAKNGGRKKSLFKSWAPQFGDMFGEEVWDFAMADYLGFARDLRRSEIISFLRQRILFVKSSHADQLSHGTVSTEKSDLENKISYQFDKGRIINDLRNVSLIFLDLRGFTELSAGDISDREIKLQLYRFFDPVVNIINHFGGTIKTYAGDGILASFGGRKLHALNAVRAAIEVHKFFALLQQEQKVAFSGMGIGIHTGLVEETYFFPDLSSPSHNTVIGLSANIVGRLSSGKTEKTGKIDMRSVKALKEYIQANDPNLMVGSGALTMFEDRLLQAVQTLQQQKHQRPKQEAEEGLSIRVLSGILNNHGIAISNATFKYIQSVQPLEEQEAGKSVRYSYHDSVLQVSLTLIKAGDAVFKGIKGKFPVWGVYTPESLKKERV
ncbi:MAG: adenylate/guanylate cyclase domain-containing protein [bacterium]|nr:adenylate/guanylate cyclase domain-containing protein [bacterium]